MSRGFTKDPEVTETVSRGQRDQSVLPNLLGIPCSLPAPPSGHPGASPPLLQGASETQDSLSQAEQFHSHQPPTRKLTHPKSSFPNPKVASVRFLQPLPSTRPGLPPAAFVMPQEVWLTFWSLSHMTESRPKLLLLWFHIPCLPSCPLATWLLGYFGALLEGRGGWSACSFLPPHPLALSSGSLSSPVDCGREEGDGGASVVLAA